MLDAATYWGITEDEPGQDWAEIRDQVVEELGAALGRILAEGTYTETLHYYSDGVVYPTASPIISCDDFYATGITIELGRQPGMGRAEVTYTGGFAAYRAGTDHDLPAGLARAIAWGIHTVIHPAAEPPVPRGLTSINVGGEYSATLQTGQVWGADGWPVPASLAAYAHLGGQCLQLAAPYRRVA